MTNSVSQTPVFVSPRGKIVGAILGSDFELDRPAHRPNRPVMRLVFNVSAAGSAKLRAELEEGMTVQYDTRTDRHFVDIVALDSAGLGLPSSVEEIVDWIGVQADTYIVVGYEKVADFPENGTQVHYSGQDVMVTGSDIGAVYVTACEHVFNTLR